MGAGPGRQRTRRVRQDDRRGVLLLVVLSILVLFAVVGVTFALVSSQFRRNAMSGPRIDQYSISYRDQLDDAAKQILRGSNSPLSVLITHSLLEDMYGFDSIVNTNTSPAIQITGAALTVGTNGQLLDITLSPGLTYPGGLYSTGYIPGYFNGRVLTMTSGPFAGRSTRIVGYSPTNSTLRVMSFEGAYLPSSAPSLPLFNQNFVINGRPFNGTGFGSNGGGLNNAKDANSRLYALLPNPKYPSHDGAYDDLGTYATAYSNYVSTYGTHGAIAFANVAGVGGADEDYDAADWNNMLLGLVAPPAPAGSGLPGSGLPYPSLHRPELVSFWVTKSGASNWQSMDQNLLRQVMLRPSPLDHPYFTGSNPAFDAVNGPWDVDTDGDGVNDSVWVDLGMPVQTAPDGTTYKPLFAIRCLDLDGRLNLNANGSSAQVENSYGQQASGYFANAGNSSINVTPNTLTSPAGTVSLGSGYGPADIDLLPLYTQQGLGPSQYQMLFGGNAAQYIEGRNGELPLAGNGSYNAGVQPSGSTPPYAGLTTGGTEALASPLGAIKHFPFPVPGSPTVPSAYQSPPDIWGRGFVATDIQGTPLYPNMSYSPTGGYDTLNNPYVLNLSRKTVRGALAHGATDNPFSPAELEAVLRAYDLDASSFSSRLARLLDPTYTGANPLGTWIAKLRNQITTDSFDLPCPNILPTRDMLNGTGATATAQTFHPADLIAARLVAGGGNVQTQLPLLLPPDLLNGLRYDINRPFGNGRDDNNDGVVDDYAEYANGELSWANVFPPSGTAVSLALDYNGSGSADASDALIARQLMARYLYTLAMALVDQNLIASTGSNPPGLAYDADGVLSSNPNPFQVQYALAQWAINCVDFRDKDSIMTPFEFDIVPFDATPIDGIINGMFGATSSDDSNTQRGLVWGCERPELLISETLAWHDRKTQDLWSGSTPAPGPAAMPGSYTTAGGTNPAPVGQPPDTDFDQHLVPQAATFIELYNPWNTQTSTLSGDNVPNPAEVPGEFYTPASGSQGVVLSATAGTNASPVWRMVFVNGTTGADPDDPIAANQPAIERSLYFIGTATAGTPLTGAVQYYTSQAVAPLKPGRYAVVGSAGQNIGGQFVSKMGRTTTGSDTTPDTVDTRRIILAPNANPDTNQVQVLLNAPTTPLDPSTIGGGGGTIQPVIAVAIDSSNSTTGARIPGSLGVSDPINGYGAISSIPVPSTLQENELQFGAAQDKPSDAVAGDSRMLANATYAGYKTVHLQRLANPLAAYDATLNPYLTIDSAPIDVRAFNGIWNGNADPNVGGGTVYKFASTQRGDQIRDTTPPPQLQQGQNNVLWAHEYPHVPGQGILTAPATGADADTGTVSNHIFSNPLHHSLGYVGQAYGTGPGTTNYMSAPGGYVGALNANPSGNQPPFPWLTWNNRPYVSPMELALVPKSRSSRLLYDFSLMPTTLPPTSLYTTQSAYPITTDNPAATAVGYILPYTANPGLTQVPYFGHLLNFFDAGTATAASNPASNPYPALNLYRIFEYLRVPSLFVGTETVLSPTGSPISAFVNPPSSLMTGDNPSGYYSQGSSLFGSYLRAPLNTVSEFRDPGRININTVNTLNSPTDMALPVASSLANSLGSNSPNLIADIQASRQANSTCSYFANPFRSFAGASLTNAIYTDPSVSSTATPLRDIDVTLLRPSAINGGTNSPTALFDVQGISGGNWQPYNDPTRSPYFRIENASKAMSLLTTRSNVYATWITVGYFQVSPWYGLNGATPPAPNTSGTVTYDTAHPDGYQLGAELGSDTGEIKRHRGFYIFDRTIPVGFQRGEDLNVENAILLRRFIE